MSNNPNFVNDLVMMAKAFEELPGVKAELEAAKHDVKVGLERIQMLELRLLDRANEIDNLNATVRKVEVERDHAERMFLETDDRLNAFRRLLAGFQTEAGALIAAAEPEQKPEPAVKVGASEGDPTPTDESGQSAGFTIEPERVTEALTVGAESEPLPTSQEPSNASASVDSGITTQPDAAPEVAAKPDPTQATESSSESGLSGLDVLHDPAYGTAPDASTTFGSGREEVTPSAADPTASSTAGDGHSQETATPASDAPSVADATTQASPFDDVGYHNEPKIDHTKHGADAWAEWDAWCARMNTRYGSGGWPPRQQAAQ